MLRRTKLVTEILGKCKYYKSEDPKADLREDGGHYDGKH